MAEIEEKTSEYIRLTKEAADLKERIEALKGWFEAHGLQDLNATKVKTVDYWGDNGRVEVGRSETVSPVALVALKSVFGAAYNELIKPKQSLEMTAACKQLLAPIYLGNYIETPLEDVITSATADEKARAALRKKLRGNFKKDVEALKKLAGLGQSDAEYYAYMASEAVAYSRFCQILKAGGWQGTVQEAVEAIRAAVVVEEGVKVTVDMKDGN